MGDFRKYCIVYYMELLLQFKYVWNKLVQIVFLFCNIAYKEVVYISDNLSKFKVLKIGSVWAI